MTRNQVIGTVGVVIVLALVGWGISQLRPTTVTPTPTPSASATVTPTATPTAHASDLPTATPTVTESRLDDLIVVTSPLPSAKMSSPVTIKGSARGSWYFEAVFPVSLRDANGTEIATGTAHADGDWMTDNYVPFTATLTFSKPATATGTLILQKDNPSGLPANDKSLSIPVTF
jgi:hypothetical protein